jgi:hypothetical protein
MDDFVVRQARISDASGVAELSGVLGYPVEADVMQRRLDQLGRREDQVVFILEKNWKILVVGVGGVH